PRGISASSNVSVAFVSIVASQIDNVVSHDQTDAHSSCPRARMSVAASHLTQHAGLHTQPFLAADVGGTHARVALLRASPGAGNEIEILAYRKCTCADFPG